MLLFESVSPNHTLALGEAMARFLLPGDVLLLEGEMGAGKSQLARGIARGLGVQGHVVSPTFTLLQIYEDGRLPLYHFDWYRLSSVDEVYELAFDEYLYGTGVALVEWPSCAPEAIPEKHLQLTLEPTGEESRRIRLQPVGGFRPVDEWKVKV